MAANLKIGIIADDNGAQKKLEGLSTSVDLTAKSVDQLRNKMAQLTVENVKLTSDIGDMVKGSQDWIQATKELKHIQETLATTTKQYDNAVQRLELSYQTGTDSLKAYKQELKMLQSQYQKAAAQGQGTGFSSGDMQNLELITNKIEEVTKKIGELEKAERIEAEQRAKNNSLTQLQNSIEQANIQGILEKQKALKEFTNTLSKANLQQQQYNAQAVNNFSSGAMSTASGQTTEYLAQGLLGNTVNQLKSDYAAYYAQLLKVISLYGTESKEAQNLAQKLNTLDGQIKDLSTQTTAATKRIGNLIKNFVSAQMIVWAIRKAFTSLVSTLKESAEAAAEAEETYNLFITTFENVATTAEKTANRLASSLGMANSTAQEALGTFGDLAAGYGATDKEALEFGETATQVAMDIISYKNISGDTATTLQSIASGLAGNVENFRKLGYVMTQAEVKTKLQKKGLDKLTGSALQYAQIQARLEILQEKSVKAQGDMQKTINSTTNVTRRLSEAWLEYKENLGESVNKAFSPIRNWWLSIMEATNKATKALETYQKTGLGTGTFDVENNDEDYKTLKKYVKKKEYFGWAGLLNLEENSKLPTKIEKAAELMTAFDTTPQMMKRALIETGKYDLGDKELERIYNELVIIKEQKDAEYKAGLNAEELKNSRISKYSSAISLIDTLSALNAVSIDSLALSGRLSDLSNNYKYDTIQGESGIETVAIDYDKDVKTITSSLIDEILSSFAETDALEFVSALDVALGNSGIDDALEAKLENAKSIYETLWNDLLSGGETTAEQLEAALENVKDVQGQINGREAWNSLGGDFSSNPLQWLIDLLAQTEAVQKFGSILADSILPALNAWLEPLLPMLEMAGSLIQNTVLPALELLFPAIKQIAYVVTMAAGAVNVAFGAIADIIKVVVGNVVYWVTDKINSILGWFGGSQIANGWAKDWANIDVGKNTQNRINEMNDNLTKIAKMSMEIADNTSSDEMDLTVLNKLFESGVIDRDEMNALRASYLGLSDPGKQTSLIAAQAGDYASYLRSGSTQNVSYGDVSIEINSESGDPEKIAKEVARVLEEWQRNGKKSFSVATA